MTDKSMYKDMWVFIEHDGREISPVSLELLCEVRKLCDRSGDRLAAVLAGELPEAELAKIRGCGTDLIIAVEGEGYFPPSVDAYTALFTRLCTERRPSARHLQIRPGGRARVRHRAREDRLPRLGAEHAHTQL